MKPRKRPRRYTGDCLRQCIARVLDMRPCDVPHFVGRYEGRWVWPLSRWCERRGLMLVIGGHTTRYVCSTIAGVKRWISIGNTADKKCHAVVLEADLGVVYDGGNPLVRHVRFMVIAPIGKRKRSGTDRRTNQRPNKRNLRPKQRKSARTLERGNARR